jgi:hypothetical protein
MSGPRPTASVLKMIRRDEHTSRIKDDKPKHASAPSLPPGVCLTVAERQMFDWLIDHVYVPGVHGTGDGAAFVKVARLWARVNEADEKIREAGLVTKTGAHGKPELGAFARLSRDLWQALGMALADIGATPSGRVRIAAARDPGHGGDSWDAVY